MTSATNDAVFDLVQRAILEVSNHSLRAGCDDQHLADAIGALAKARELIRPMSFVKKPGYIECEGSFMGNHTRLGPNIGKCRYCHSAVSTVHYGRNLRQHYVANLPELSKLPPVT